VKVKLFLGALGGELSAELPFVLMHPKVIVISHSIRKVPGSSFMRCVSFSEIIFA
jgi:hypothetical protein